MNEQMYSYMHAILGPEIMSELDRLNENDEQKKAAVREEVRMAAFCFRKRGQISQKTSQRVT